MRTNIQLKFLGQNSKFPFINYFFPNDVGSFFELIFIRTHIMLLSYAVEVLSTSKYS